MGSTLLGIFERYSDELRAHDSKLMLAEIGSEAKGVLHDTEHVCIYGRENIYLASEVLGESILEVCHDAQKWIDENKGVE